MRSKLLSKMSVSNLKMTVRRRFLSKHFGENHKILHFSYHKCLTVYYKKVTKALSNKYNFYADRSSPSDWLNQVRDKKSRGIFSVYCPPVLPFNELENYVGSHFIRNPRDLVVSGYNYHLWTEEPWCIDKNFNWDRYNNHTLFTQYILDKGYSRPEKISFQEYLKSLDKETGINLEILWRSPQLTFMENWDYNNPKIIEMKYEDIVGNEVEQFSRLFEHYGFKKHIIEDGLQFVEKFSMKNKKESSKHIQHGGFDQWRSTLTGENVELFQSLHPHLMEKLSYNT